MLYRGQLDNVVVRSPERRQANLLRELGKGRVGEERDVAEKLVTDIGLWRVVRLGEQK